MKTFRFTYKYDDSVINLILKGRNQIEALKVFENYAKKFKLPINHKISIKIKELRNNHD